MTDRLKYILGIETSCDETSASVITPTKVLSNIISSQSVHLQFGGVVPELASRAHLKKIIPIVNDALGKAEISLNQIEGIAVTNGPGLIGALLVGVNYAKGLSFSLKKPLVGVHHIEGHIYANFMNSTELKLPAICLVVSGGHTQIVIVQDFLKYKIIGETRDDAVGEAFDKAAKLLNLPYPGGPEIDNLAKNGNPDFVSFPRALLKSGDFSFSYSGLKTAVLNYIEKNGNKYVERNLNDICSSFQKAAMEVLVKKTVSAARMNQIRNIMIAGGVAANSLLRNWMKSEAEKFHLQVFYPSIEYCTDNAAMIARAGCEYLMRGYTDDLSLNVYPSLRIGEKVRVS